MMNATSSGNSVARHAERDHLTFPLATTTAFSCVFVLSYRAFSILDERPQKQVGHVKLPNPVAGNVL